jgi:hypothetical protein
VRPLSPGSWVRTMAVALLGLLAFTVCLGLVIMADQGAFTKAPWLRVALHVFEAAVALVVVASVGLIGPVAFRRELSPTPALTLLRALVLAVPAEVAVFAVTRLPVFALLVVPTVLCCWLLVVLPVTSVALPDVVDLGARLVVPGRRRAYAERRALILEQDGRGDAMEQVLHAEHERRERGDT